MALVPPAIASGWLWSKVRDNIFLSVLVLISYWAIVGVLRVLLRLGRAVTDLWIPRIAAAADRRLSAIAHSYRGRYLEQLIFNVREVEMLGMTTQGEFALQLQDIYVDVSLARAPLQSTAHAPFVGTDLQGGERRSLDTFLSDTEPRIFAVIGGPGSGKTTLLRRTAMMLAERRRGRRSLPLLLYLRDHVQAIIDNPNVTIPELLAEVSWIKGRVTADWFERALSRARCVVMLDGLDEVAVEDHRQLTSRWVQRQVKRYPENHFVLTSRPYGYHSNPVSGADILQVRRFTSEQIFRFVHVWYEAIERRRREAGDEHSPDAAATSAADLLQRMRAQPALFDLGANPMLLTMIANVHKYRGALPGTRAALYNEMCELLLHRRQEAKNIQVGSALKPEQRAKVVRKLALAMMSQEVRDIRLSNATEIIGPSLDRIPRSPQADDFLDALTKSGLFVEREVGTYAFAHQTLQEYLAAAEIRDHFDEISLPDLVDNPWWRETILLWAADADATPVVAACLESGSVDALALAYDCQEEAREVDAELVRRLDGLLYSESLDGEATTLAAHRQLMAAVLTSRSLRYTVTLGNDAVVCANAFPQSIYRLFAEQSGSPVLDCPQSTEPDAPVDAVPAVGVPAWQVEQLVAWINSLFEDGTAYRLPTRRELADPMTEVVVDIERHTIWYADPAPQSGPSLDGDGGGVSTPGPAVNGYAGPHIFVPRGVTHPFIASHELLEHGVRSDLAAAGGILPFVLSLSLERNPDRARVRNFRGTISRLQRLEISVTPALLSGRTHVDRAFARSAHGYMEMSDVGSGATRMRELARRLTEVKHPSIATEFVQELRLSVGQDKQFERSLGQALDIVLAHSVQTDELMLLVRKIKSPGSGDDYAETLLTWPEVAESPNTFELFVVGLTLLLSVWEPDRVKGRQRQTASQFELFLDGLCSPSAEIVPTLPEQIKDALDDLQSMLLTAAWTSPDARQPYGAGADPGSDEESWRFLARRIVELISALRTAASHDPSGSVPSHSAMRIGLLAVSSVADKFTDSQIAAKARGIHSSLTCVDARRSDPKLASEVILLMRI